MAIATEPEEEETADSATPIKPTQRVGGTSAVFYKDHVMIVHDKNKVVPSRTETHVDLAEANKKMKA